LSALPNLATEAGFTGGTPQVLEVVAGDQGSEVWVHLVHGCSFGCCCCLVVGRGAAGVGRGEDWTRRSAAQT
jgi:hypothetical protein